MTLCGLARDALHKRPASLFSRVLPQPAGANRPPTRQTSFFTPPISASDRLVFPRTPQYVPLNLSRPPQSLHSIAKAKHVTASLAKTRRPWPRRSSPSPTRSHRCFLVSRNLVCTTRGGTRKGTRQRVHRFLPRSSVSFVCTARRLQSQTFLSWPWAPAGLCS